MDISLLDEYSQAAAALLNQLLTPNLAQEISPTGETKIIIFYEGRTCQKFSKKIAKVAQKSGFKNVEVVDSNALIMEPNTPNEQAINESKIKTIFNKYTHALLIRGSPPKLNNSPELLEGSKRLIRLFSTNIKSHFSEDKGKRYIITRSPETIAEKAQVNAGQTIQESMITYTRAMQINYQALAKAATPLEQLMQKTKHVHITGPDTDLTFNLSNERTSSKACTCFGRRNLPGGEVFTAPMARSLNGKIVIKTPNGYLGENFKEIHLKFENGLIIEAHAENEERTKALNELLNQDAGFRSAGEFAIGLNPFITQTIIDTLFDEKIAGSFHIALGSAAPTNKPPGTTDNNLDFNKSAFHWDIISKPDANDHPPTNIYFDNELIWSNGRFISKNLQHLNPEKLEANLESKNNTTQNFVQMKLKSITQERIEK